MLKKLAVCSLLTVTSAALASAQQQLPGAQRFPTEKRIERSMIGVPISESYLGVVSVEISKDNFAAFGLREVRGVGIEKVAENSPAAKAGLQKNDVIVRFNGEEITSVRKLTRLISETAPQHQARITILRNGAEQEISATLGTRQTTTFQMSRPDGFQSFPNVTELPDLGDVPLLRRENGVVVPPISGDGNAMIMRSGAARQIGVGITSLTPQLAEYFGVTEGTGVLIDNVRENSPASRAGIKAGDVIVQIDDKNVKNSVDLVRVISEKKQGDVSLTIVRDKTRQTLRVTPEAAPQTTMPFTFKSDDSDNN